MPGELSDSVRLLVAMADAFATPHPNTGGREPLLFLQYMGGQNLQHHAFDATEWASVDEETLERLADQGLIRLDYGGQHSLKIYVTVDGERVAREAQRLLNGEEESELDPVDLDWEAVAQPVLEATYQAWIGRGAPADGVLTSAVADQLQEENLLQTYRTLSLLVEGGYLDQAGALATEHGPAAVSVTAKGLQVVGGWPATTGEAAVGALLTALDRAIDEADEPERRTKLERLREVALDVGQGTLAEVLKHLVTGGL